MKHDRQKRYQERQDALGMAQVKVRVHRSDIPAVKQFARQLRQLKRGNV